MNRDARNHPEEKYHGHDVQKAQKHNSVVARVAYGALNPGLALLPITCRLPLFAGGVR